MLLVAVVLAAVSKSKTIPCTAVPMATYPPLVHEYEMEPTAVTLISHNNRERREVSDFVRRFPLGSLDIAEDEVALSSAQRRTIHHAYQYIILLYNLDDNTTEPHTFHITTSATIPPDNRVGEWNGITITLFLNVITSIDMLFTITLHEMFHSLAFGTVDVGNGSFTSRSDGDQHTGANVLSCLNKTRSYTDNVYTDATRAHWKDNTDPFTFDVMEPVLPTNGVDISPCTIAAVIDTRPTWTSLSCTDDTDCPTTNHTCASLGKHLGNVCLILGASSNITLPHATQYPQFTAFVYTLIVFFVGLKQCVRLPQHKHGVLAHILDPTTPPSP
jgi:hypothetical protein